MTRITALDVIDVRFPTSRGLDGSDAMNPEPDYSAAYLVVRTDDPEASGYSLLFTTGRGNDVACAAVRALGALRRRPRRGRAGRRRRRVRAGAGLGRAAALARPGEGRHAHGHRRGRQRRVGPARPPRGPTPLAGAGRSRRRRSSPRSTSPTSTTPSRRPRRWPSFAAARNKHERDRHPRAKASRPTRRRRAGSATTTTRSSGSRAKRSPTASRC